MNFGRSVSISPRIRSIIIAPCWNGWASSAASAVASKQRATGPSRFKLAGVVVSKQERTSKNGNKFAFVQLSDGGGAFEITVFSELLAAQRDLLEAGQAVLIEVDAQAGQRRCRRGRQKRR